MRKTQTIEKPVHRSKLVRLYPETIARIESLRGPLKRLSEREGAVANVRFVKNASFDTLVFLLTLEVEKHLKRELQSRED